MLNEDSIKLTPRQKGILQKMLDEGEDIVASGREVWCGLEQVNWKLVYNLLRLCFIKEDGYGGGSEHYVLSGSGKNFLTGKRPIYEY